MEGFRGVAGGVDTPMWDMGTQGGGRNPVGRQGRAVGRASCWIQRAGPGTWAAVESGGQGLRVHVLRHASAIPRLCLRELRSVLARSTSGVVSLATGATFRAMLRNLEPLLRPAVRGEVPLTHLDEFLGFRPEQAGGMVHELLELCPLLRDELCAGRFWPVPATGAPADLQAHEQRLEAAGGIALQLLGLGRNGHIAFVEPGVDFGVGFHVARLAASTRADAQARFGGGRVPEAAVTAGPATIFGARRVLLAATGCAKAEAVRAMIEGPITPACPASLLQRHPDACVLLDPEAAVLLRREGYARTSR